MKSSIIQWGQHFRGLRVRVWTYCMRLGSTVHWFGVFLGHCPPKWEVPFMSWEWTNVCCSQVVENHQLAVGSLVVGSGHGMFSYRTPAATIVYYFSLWWPISMDILTQWGLVMSYGMLSFPLKDVQYQLQCQGSTASSPDRWNGHSLHSQRGHLSIDYNEHSLCWKQLFKYRTGTECWNLPLK